MRSALAGWAEYGYCASHSRFFWGLRLRLRLVCTVHGLPVGWALTRAKTDERATLLAVLDTKDSSTSRATAGAPPQESAHASPNEPWP